MSIIHIAPDLAYLFNPDAATVLCGRVASEVFASGEFIGVAAALNPKCSTCTSCLQVLNSNNAGEPHV